MTVKWLQNFSLFAKVFDFGSRVFRFISGELKVILNSQSSMMVLFH